MTEPSVYDYLISKIFFWKNEPIAIPKADEPADGEGEPTPAASSPPETIGDFVSEDQPVGLNRLPQGAAWKLARILVPLIFALIAQKALEPPGKSVLAAVLFYLLAAAWLIWAIFQHDWRLPKIATASYRPETYAIRMVGFWLFLPLFVLAFLMFGENRFTSLNALVWGAGLAAFLLALWQPNPAQPGLIQRVRAGIRRFFARGITFSPWTVLVLAVFALSAFYRFYRLEQVPAEMFSDHAEKLLDVGELLAGETRIFFPRNTGREAFQMYLTAAMALWFKTGLSFLSLKLGTALSGLLTLPFIYLLGKEIANKRVGLFAMFFAGIAYWPNVISRVALRFTLYPTFTAPALYFFIRGMRRGGRNDFILAGIFLGLGLHGYSPYRFVPLLLVLGLGLYLLHRHSAQEKRQAVWGLGVTAFTSLVIFLPLLRYAISNPEMFSYRMMTRMGQAERAFPGSPLAIFFDNTWKAIIMPFWDNGQIWVHSVPFRPALDFAAAALFFIGLVMVVIRYGRDRNWTDLFLLTAYPLLMVPSILSIAFPDENPSLNRTGGALIVVFVIVAIALDGLYTALKSDSLKPVGKWLGLGLAAILMVFSASQNFDLVFRQFDQQFRANAWNTSELGAVIRQFADTAGAEDSAWVVPYPHWVDTRLVGIRAGFPQRDYALWRDQIGETVGDPRAKLYLVKPDDIETLDLLEEIYPASVTRLYESQVPGRDFYIVSVPPVK